jgi:ferredoxin-NADP reductase
MAQPVRFQATVEQLIRHTPDVITLHLQATRRLPRFIPGQFVHLTVDEFDPASFWPESRVFSVANAVADRRSVKLTISRQGDYTGRIVDGLKTGDLIWGKGPYGQFVLDGSHDYYRAVLIAGGTGITPFGAFMDAALTAGNLPVKAAILYYGAQTEELLLYREMADECAKKVPGFQVQYFSEAKPQNPNPDIQQGRLDIAAILAEQSDISQTAFFLSGPKPMIDAFQGYLQSQGLASEQILIDAWE